MFPEIFGKRMCCVEENFDLCVPIISFYRGGTYAGYGKRQLLLCRGDGVRLRAGGEANPLILKPYEAIFFFIIILIIPQFG